MATSQTKSMSSTMTYNYSLCGVNICTLTSFKKKEKKKKGVVLLKWTWVWERFHVQADIPLYITEFMESIKSFVIELFHITFSQSKHLVASIKEI